MLGVYDHPPDDDAINSVKLDAATFSGWDSVVQRQVLKGAYELTRLKDALHSLL